MGKFIDLTGQRFHNLIVLHKTVPYDGKWTCRCDCGKTTETRGQSLKSGHTTSCGCNAIHLIDLCGKTFGRWTVISRAPHVCKRTAWNCKCDCGNVGIILSINLLRGMSKSCGCLRHKSPPNMKDLIGLRFGRLIVVSRSRKNNQGGTTWNCRCDCGKEKIISGTCLLNIGTKSCGCLNREMTKKRNMKDLIGQRFGRLIVISQENSKKHCVFWKCKCDCGNYHNVRGTCLLRGNTVSCGCYNDALISMRVNNPEWKDFIRMQAQMYWEDKKNEEL